MFFWAVTGEEGAPLPRMIPSGYHSEKRGIFRFLFTATVFIFIMPGKEDLG
jgi:hypothetical protein